MGAGCDAGGGGDAAVLVEAVRGLDLRSADASEIARQVVLLRALELRDPDARRVRDACVSFREALARAEAARAAAGDLEAAGDLGALEAALPRIEDELDRAERFGVACEDGVRALAAP